MNTRIYPLQDTYLNSNNINKNFGIDEILEIKAKTGEIKEISVPGSPWQPFSTVTSNTGKKGWVAYSNNNYYVWCSDTQTWEILNLSDNIATTTDISSEPIHLVAFNGLLTSTDTVDISLSGSAATVSSSFCGYIYSADKIRIAGECTTGSFDGRIYAGSSFEKLVINGNISDLTPPLREDVLGSGYFEGFTGSLYGSFHTGINNSICNGILSGGAATVMGAEGRVPFTGSIYTTGSAIFNVSGTTDFYYKGQLNGNIYPDSNDLPYFALTNYEFSRILLKFDFTTISESIAADNNITSPQFILKLINCTQRNLPFNYNIYAFPISQSWDGGNGRYVEDSNTYGTNWYYKDFENGSLWYNPLSTRQINATDYFLTESIESFNHGGATWYYKNPITNESYLCSQSFAQNDTGDISINITNIVNSWISNEIPNEGIILMISQEVKPYTGSYDECLLQFYSKESNTIYSPTVQISWDDSEFLTGDLAPANIDNGIIVNFNNLAKTYKSGEILKINVFSREKYQLKLFNKAIQQPNMVTPKYLPASSYYMLKDAESEFVLYDFSDYTKLSCDDMHGNYFWFDTTGLPLERYYTFYIKSVFDSGEIVIFKSDKVFKIVR